MSTSLKAFFAPGSVAVIGASRTPDKAGYNIIENMLKLGYPGVIYPVNPEARKILGVAAYPSITDTPATPELALITVPPPLVMPVFEECLKKGTRNIIIVSAGFAETSAEGARTQRKIAAMARSAGARVMGPNSIGTVNPGARFITSFGRLSWVLPPHTELTPGHLAVVGQTGLLPTVYLPMINAELGLNVMACLGNKCDIDESDLLEYLADDPQTSVIAMHLESIKDGRRFLRLSRRTNGRKPIVVLKTATTPVGARVSATHTASLAGEDRVYDAAFRQAGITRAADFEQLFDLAKGFLLSPPLRGRRVAIINVTGAGCVMAADTCAREGLEIASLSAETLARVQAVYPSWWEVRNPLDVWTAIETSGFETTYATLTRAAMEDEGVDAVIAITGVIDHVPAERVARIFKEIKRDVPDKPLFVVKIRGNRDSYEQLCQELRSARIPAYASGETAVLALGALWRYRRYREGAG